MKPLLILVSAVLALLICAPACWPGKTATALEAPCNDFMKLKNISRQVEAADGGIVRL